MCNTAYVSVYVLSYQNMDSCKHFICVCTFTRCFCTHVNLMKLTVNTCLHQVIQRRFNGYQDFYQTWQEYKQGFGDSDGEFWLGNDLIHSITTSQSYVLRIDMTSGDSTATAEYNDFSLDSEMTGYVLRLGEYRDSVSTAGKSNQVRR